VSLSVLVTLKSRWHDRTTHLLFEPVEFLAKLAARRPRVNLTIYSGVLRRTIGGGRRSSPMVPTTTSPELMPMRTAKPSPLVRLSSSA
jgi:hypothetical protein